MDKELQELVDRRAIDDLLLRYSTALDTRQWDLLDQVFTADAAIDYGPSGGVKGTSEDLKCWFPRRGVHPLYVVAASPDQHGGRIGRRRRDRKDQCLQPAGVHRR